MSKLETDAVDAQPEAEASTVEQPRTAEQFEGLLDSGLAEFERVQRLSNNEPEAEPEAEQPERDFGNLVRVQGELMKEGEIQQAADLHDLEGVDLDSPDEIRARLLELQENDDEAAATERSFWAGQEAEADQQSRLAAIEENAAAVLENGDPEEIYEAATLLRSSPELAELQHGFMRRWAAEDPDTAGVWSGQNPPIDWAEREDEAAEQIAQAQANVEHRQEQLRQQGVVAAWNEREKELRSDPKTARFLDPALAVIQAQVDSDPSFGLQSPEQARALLDASVKVAREIMQADREADKVSKMLAPFDRMMAVQDARMEEERGLPFPDIGSDEEIREQTRDRLLAEYVSQVRPKPTVKEKDGVFYDAFERAAKSKAYYGFDAGEDDELTPGEKAYGEEMKRRFDERRRIRSGGR